MANHYITIDGDGRIIDGFSDAFKRPGPGDILIRENAGAPFELFGKDPNRPLGYISQGVEIWRYKWTGTAAEARTREEIAADLPPHSYEPTADERIANNTYAIENINMALSILLGTEAEK